MSQFNLYLERVQEKKYSYILLENNYTKKEEEIIKNLKNINDLKIIVSDGQLAYLYSKEFIKNPWGSLNSRALKGHVDPKNVEAARNAIMNSEYKNKYLEYKKSLTNSNINTRDKLDGNFVLIMSIIMIIAMMGIGYTAEIFTQYQNENQIIEQEINDSYEYLEYDKKQALIQSIINNNYKIEDKQSLEEFINKNKESLKEDAKIIKESSFFQKIKSKFINFFEYFKKQKPIN